MKPQLADNWLKDKTRLPAWAQPKWDGVRGLYITEQFTGRSLKTFKNKALTAFWSHPIFKWLDGELIFPGATEDTPRLCSITSGLTGRVHSEEVPDLIAFDYLNPTLINKGAVYKDRYDHLRGVVEGLQGHFGPIRIRLIENYPVMTMEKLLALDEQFLDRNLEGTIIRNPDAYYKEGRPSVRTQELMRIKRFIDFEFVIEALVEARENQNEAKINELGHTERSSHQENKVGKGMVGTFRGRFHRDVVYDGKTLFKEGDPVLVGAGQSTHKERIEWWNAPLTVLGQIGKAKLFPQGILKKPRMPIFLGLRSEEDMSD